MSTLNIKCRWPGGTKTVQTNSSTSWLAFREELAVVTGIDALYQKICAGFPPKELVLASNASVSSAIRNGDAINVSQSDTPVLEVPQLHEQVVESKTEHPVATTSTDPVSAPEQVEHGEELSKPVVETKPARPTEADLAEFETQSDYGQIVRRVMPDDNSCLFHAIAYVLEGEKVAKQATLTRLRSVISKVVKEDDVTYDAATLGKSNSEYARWITQPNSWGGAIELSIFARVYATEIYALDVINGFGNCFGELEGYGRRVYVIFDGIHYDAIAISPIQEELDLDLVEVKPWDQAVEQMAVAFLQKEHKAGKFTDTQKFQILCQQCQTVLVGEKGAAMHAMSTGHSQFVEKR